MPLVSIIIPIYNVKDYITQCLNSIINQTYRNIEIILIDDGSNDGSERICDEYALNDMRIKAFHLQNGGAAYARNYGLENAHGKYVYTCDSDDYIDCDAITQLVNIAEEKKTDCIIFNSYSFYDNSPVFKGKYIRCGKYSDMSGKDMARQLLINNEYKPGTPLCFYNYSFLKTNNIRFYQGIICEDELFSFFVFLKAKLISYYPYPLYFRRIREGSVMTSSKHSVRKFISCYTVLVQIYNYCISNNLINQKVCQEYLIRMSKSTLYAYRQLTIEGKKSEFEIYDKTKEIIRSNFGFGDYSLILRTYNWYIGLLFSGLKNKIRALIYGTR